MKRLAISITLALVVFIVAPSAALAQENDPPDGVENERFSTEETQRLSQEINEREARWESNDRRIDQLTEDFEFGDERDELRAENRQLSEENPYLREDLVDERFRVIQDEPSTGSAEERLTILEEKRDALRSLVSYSGNVYGDSWLSEDVDKTRAIEDELDATEEEMASVREEQAADEQASQEEEEEEEQDQGGAVASGGDSGDDGGSGGGGDDGGSSSDGSGTGPLEAAGGVVSGIVWGLVSLAALAGVVLAGMFAWAYRRERDVYAAWEHVREPKRLAIAAVITLVLSALGGFSTIFALSVFLFFIFIILFFPIIFVASWFLKEPGESKAEAFGTTIATIINWTRRDRSPGYSGGNADNPDEGRRGRNVAGARGEAQVNEALAAQPREGYHAYVFANLWEPSVGNIDHVLVCGKGILVVETKANKGRITLDKNDNLSADGRPFSRNPFEQAESQGEAMLERLGNDVPIGQGRHGYLVCCTGASSLARSPESQYSHLLFGLDELSEWLPAFLSLNDLPCSNSEVDSIAEQIMGYYGTAPIASPTTGPNAPSGNLPRPAGANPEPTVGGTGGRAQNDNTTTHRRGPPPEPEKRELTDDLRERLKNMESVMAESIVGQEEAVREVSTAMRRRIAGQFQGEQPASFLFLGPTGVGKTEVANTLADEMYGGKEEMIRLDMSEYKSDADIARLTGAPAGYIGHDASNPLTDKMYENPERVVLFDEIEKAHQDVFNVFLQILDAGRLTDGHGNVIPFQYSSVILTSNLLTREITQIKADGGQIDNAQIKQALIEQGIKPEIVNRLGRIVVFDALSMNDVREVATRMLKKPAKSMQERHGVELTFSEEAISKIAELGYEPEFGARPLRAVIEREVEDRLSDLLLDQKIGRGQAVEFDVHDDGSLGVRPARRTPR